MYFRETFAEKGKKCLQMFWNLISLNVYASDFQYPFHSVSKGVGSLLLLEQMVEFQQNPAPAQLSRGR